MPAGFQVINQSGSYQIDGEYANLALARKGTVGTQTFPSGDGSPTLQTRAAVTVNDGELIAFACASAPVAISAKVDNQVYIQANGPAGTVISYWIFSAGTTDSDFGLQVFSGSGKRMFDSSWKLFNVVSLASGRGTLNLTAGRTYAVLPQSVWVRVQRELYYQGAQPNVYVVMERNTFFDAVRIQGAQITVQSAQLDLWMWVRRESEGTPIVNWPYDGNNGVTTQYVVIDVTGL